MSSSYFDSKKNHIYFFRFLKICSWEKKLIALWIKVICTWTSSRNACKLAATCRARRVWTRSWLATRFRSWNVHVYSGIFSIQEYCFFYLLSHSVSSRRIEQIRIVDRTVKMPFFCFPDLSSWMLWNKII